MSAESPDPAPGQETVPVTQRERTPHVLGKLVASRRVGAYHHLSFRAPEVAELAVPGQFIALAVGGQTSATLLRRCFSIYRVSPGRTPSPQSQSPSPQSHTSQTSHTSHTSHSEPAAGTVDIVVAARGAGTRWLADLSTHDEVSIIGPLGGGFPLPAEPVACVLVGGGYGSAPLFWLAAALRERGCRVEMVLGAASEDRLFGVDEAERAGRDSGGKGAKGAGDGVTVTTDDGSLGVRGRVSDVLPEVIRRSQAEIVYGCGPMAMLESVTEVATAQGAVAQVAVEESMACGIGVCMTCVMPVTGSDGQTRMVRSCVEGPVFRGDQIRWDAFENGWCRVPGDAYGAEAMRGH